MFPDERKDNSSCR